MVPIWSRRKRSAWQHMLTSLFLLCFCWLDSQALSGDTNAPGAALATPSPALWWVCAAAHPEPLHAGAHPRFRHLPPPQASCWNGKERHLPPGRILSFAKRPFILDPAQQVISISVRWGVVCSGNQAAKQDAHSIFPRVLLPVPHGCLPCQNIWEWLIQLPRTTTWECMTKTPAAIYWGPHYQRKDYYPAAGRGMNPGECAKIMWGLVNKHGLGRRHSQSHGIRHTACRKENRWHENSLFSPSASRRSYWWETCQNFPKSQSLS